MMACEAEQNALDEAILEGTPYIELIQFRTEQLIACMENLPPEPNPEEPLSLSKVLYRAAKNVEKLEKTGKIKVKKRGK